MIQLKDSATFSCTDCTIRNNSALQSSILSPSRGATFNIIDSTISESSATAFPFAQLVDTKSDNKIRNSQIVDNIFRTKADQLAHLFAHPSFEPSYQAEYTKEAEFLEDKEILINLQQSQLTFEESSVVIGDNLAIIAGFQSTLVITGAEMKNSISPVPVFDLISSDFTGINSKFTNLSATQDYPSFRVNEGTVSFESCNLTESDSILFSLQRVMINLLQTTFSGIRETVFSAREDSNIISSASTFSSFETAFDITNSVLKILNGTLLKDSTKPAVTTSASNVIFENSFIENCSGGMYLDQNSVTTINGGTLKKNGQMGSLSGSIQNFESDLTILNSRFEESKSLEGGSILTSCLTSCTVKIESTQFIDSMATGKGGAILYRNFRPTFKNLTFTGCIAPYGREIASYPVEAKILANPSRTLIDQVSGQDTESTIEIELIDFEGRRAEEDSSSVISILNPTSQKVKSIKVTKGVADFSTTIFLGKTGSQNNNFSIIVDSIKPKELQTWLLPAEYSTLEDSLTVSFRECKAGEYEELSQCFDCPAQTYSLLQSQSVCKECNLNSQCPGKEVIDVDEGYWRESVESDTLYICLEKSACKGGYFPENENPVECTEGYTGILCQECKNEEGIRYARQKLHECVKCPNKFLNAIRIFAIVFFCLCFVFSLVIMNLRKKKESAISIMSRILTNYLHCSTASLSYNLAFPSYLQTSSVPSQQVSQTSSSVLSFECFLDDFKIGPSLFLMKALASSFVPLLFLILYVSVFMIAKAIRPQRIDFKRAFLVTLITLLFFFHPQLTEKTLAFFKCTTIEGESRMIFDLPMTCWEGTHLLMLSIFWIPMFFLWIVGLPGFGIVFLYINRKNLLKQTFADKYLILYQGMKTNRGFWEMLNIFRKVALLSINVFLPEDQPFYKATAGIGFLIFFWRLQLFLKPFKLEVFNQLEEREMLTSVSTLYAGILFLQPDASASIQFITFSFIILTNFYFFSFFGLVFLTTFQTKIRALVWLKIFLHRVSFA